ncbi:bromodomain adjacent to zinc finger domain protein 1A [Neocloeon triangulifer]|uniref:bromodomain adjacent to zinc finger domain protein 1A n=1 Tax=Neocloeon triangulifer TaxID=2078957 RepID=UPI00286F078F|nr:bromodomain adjacent to zinc finger domain protein 1A [Neocloeon triangulifer]
MPLLRKKQFEPIKAPKDLRPDEEVFFCSLTGEIFRDYEEFYERIILCNSLVWSCSLTGKPNLTYSEALQSEESALQSIKGFSKELHIPVLLLAKMTHRTSFLDMTEDVFTFVKDRYFVGETIEAVSGNDTIPCTVLKVIPPDRNSPSKSPEKSASKFGNIPDASLYRYEITASKVWPRRVVAASDLKRRKSIFTRDKNKLFLKQNTESGSRSIRVKESAVKKYNLDSANLSDYFAGPTPEFPKPKRLSKLIADEDLTPEEREKRVRAEKRKEKRMMAKEGQLAEKKRKMSEGRSPLKNGNSPTKSPKPVGRPKGSVKKEGVKKLTAEQIKQKMIEDAKREKEHEKLVKKEERSKAREKAREEKRLLDEFYKEWNKPKDDLMCEDLKELPDPCAVQCSIPNHLFGEFMAILEFLHCFKEELEVKNFFPQGMSFDVLQRALVEHEIAGPLSDLLQLMLASIFTMQEEEEDEVQTAEADAIVDTGECVTSEEAAKSAAAAANWSQTFQGCPIYKLNLDHVTLTEILRLHLLGSGSKAIESNPTWRGQNICDDPGLSFRVDEPQILKSLTAKTVMDLTIGEKLKVLTCLMHQILQFGSIRETINERNEKLKQAKNDLRSVQLVEKKREMEELMKNRVEKQKKKEGEITPEEQEKIDDEKTKREKENSRKHAEFLAKEQKMLDIVQSLEWGVAAVYLGNDRAHRRYWLFQALSGVYVENDVENIGPCLEKPTPDPIIPLCEDSLKYVRHLYELKHDQKEEISCGSSDKENERSPHPAGKNKKHKGKPEDEEDEIVEPSKTLKCTAEQDSCPVHSTVLPRTKWSFFNRPNELDALIKNLNLRGIRENELRQSLLLNRNRIEQSMAKCPANVLGRPDDVVLAEIDPPRKSSRNTGGSSNKHKEDANLNFPKGTPMAEIMESTLRDVIIDMEEKIHLGGLGTLKVTEREKWRDSIINGGYDQLCSKLTWGGKKNACRGSPPSERTVSKLKMEERSRPGTPDSIESGSVYQESVAMETEPSCDDMKKVRSLASAILQIEQAVEAKYLQKPLGEDEKEKQKRLKKLQKKAAEDEAEEEDEPNEEDPKADLPNQIERWEVSLMACTSFSQLFLHFSTLENSILWSKSALNARCRICRRKGDGENMLLCDSCDKGHHLYCLKPPLSCVPSGEWFCPSCRPKSLSPRKVRKFLESEDEDEDLEEEEESESDEEEEESQCVACGEQGDLVKCEECRHEFHPACALPPLRCVPRSAWKCQECRDKPAKKSKAKKKRHGAVVLAQKPHNSRRSARDANTKISKAAKRLRSNSWDDSDTSRNGSVAGDEVPSRDQRVRRRPRWMASDSPEDECSLNAQLLRVVLDELMGHTEAWPFLRPVSKQEAPDYHTIIKRPMDLGTMKYKLNMMEYRNNSEFLADAHLVFDNCELYNQADADEFKSGAVLRKFFERKCNEFALKLVESDLEPPNAKKARRAI